MKARNTISVNNYQQVTISLKIIWNRYNSMNVCIYFLFHKLSIERFSNTKQSRWHMLLFHIFFLKCHLWFFEFFRFFLEFSLRNIPIYLNLLLPFKITLALSIDLCSSNFDQFNWKKWLLAWSTENMITLTHLKPL